jgi:FkbM family methyltransferase
LSSILESANNGNSMASNPPPASECWPANARDWFISQCGIRFGRIDKFAPGREIRKALLSLVGRDHGAARYRTAYGFDILLPAWDSGILIAALNGRILHPRLTEIFRAVIQPGDTFVDGGANMGFYSLLAAKVLKGSGCVVSFEPDPRNIPILHSNVVMNCLDGLIRIEPKALSDRECESDFWSAPENAWGGSLVKRPGVESKRYQVSATTLDQYVVSTRLRPVDIIKLDIEGAEPRALRGMRGALRTARMVVYEIDKPRLDHLDIKALDLIRRTNNEGDFEVTLVSDELSDEIVALEDARTAEILNRDGWANVVSAKGDAAIRLREMFGI